MIKTICKNFSVFILLIFISIIAFKIGQWRMWRPKEDPGTVFITDTLDYEYPDYVEKPGLIFRFTHKSIPPRSIQPVAYKLWMDSIFSAIVLIKRGKEVEMILKRGTVVDRYFVDDVPDDFEFYGTSIGYNIIKHRFKNPFGWNGILIGSEFYDLYNDINPYVETGIRIKCININIGIDKYSIREKIPCYIDVNYKVW